MTPCLWSPQKYSGSKSAEEPQIVQLVARLADGSLPAKMAPQFTGGVLVLTLWAIRLSDLPVNMTGHWAKTAHSP